MTPARTHTYRAVTIELAAYSIIEMHPCTLHTHSTRTITCRSLICDYLYRVKIMPEKNFHNESESV